MWCFMIFGLLWMALEIRADPLCENQPNPHWCRLYFEHLPSLVDEAYQGIKLDLERQGLVPREIEKRKPGFVRFGKRRPAFVRMGKRKLPVTLSYGKRSSGKRRPAFVRFGK